MERTKKSTSRPCRQMGGSCLFLFMLVLRRRVSYLVTSTHFYLNSDDDSFFLFLSPYRALLSATFLSRYQRTKRNRALLFAFHGGVGYDHRDVGLAEDTGGSVAFHTSFVSVAYSPHHLLFLLFLRFPWKVAIKKESWPCFPPMWNRPRTSSLPPPFLLRTTRGNASLPHSFPIRSCGTE